VMNSRPLMSAIMGVTFLAEIGFFILLGMF